MESKQDWKQLYQDCKRELDHHDLQLVELQKGLLRLALTFIGRNPDFDKLLRLITSSVRDSQRDSTIEGKLLAVINWISKFAAADITRLNGQSQPEYANKYEEELPVISPIKFAEFLKKIPSDLEMQVEMEVLTGRLKLTHSDEDLNNLIEDAASLLSEHSLSVTSQTIPLSESDNNQLVQLLEKVSFDKEHLARVNHVKSVLTGKVADDRPVAEYILVAELLNKSVMRDKNIEEVGIFLKKMTQRLESLHIYLNQSELINTNHFTETFSLGQDLDEQFNEIKDGLESSGSIAAMKFNIEAHLDFLNKNVSDYVRKEKDRMRHAEETLGALNSQLDVLQVETKVLKKSVEQEQVKSLTDALTAIANRRAYEERLEVEIARWHRHGSPLSLMVFDLDKFKSINDNYGHVVGDKVLQGLTATFRREIRRTDFLARYGGEEFVMIMPETALQQTMVIADKLRSEVEQCVFRYQGQQVPVTVSIGVAEFHENDTGESVFQRADKALYLAKNSGRNICRSEAHLTEPA